MHVALEEPEPVDERPADYPDRRPRRYGACLRLGLGERLPCVFLTCRFNLLADELQGPRWDGESPLEGRATCALRVAAEGRHNAEALASVMGHCESTIEEWLRRGQAKYLWRLGINEFIRDGRFRRPKHHGCKLDSGGTDGLAALVEARFRLPMPPLNTAPVRRLSREEVERVYPGMIHPAYGQPREERAIPGAVGGAVAATCEQEAETPKETEAPVARESNTQNADARHVDSLLIDRYKCD